MTEAAPAAIVHYHEISLKRGNRPLFLRQLHQNLLRAIGDLGPVELVQLSGRVMLDLSRHPAPRLLPERLARVAGVANFALAIRTGVSREALRAAVEEAIAGRVFGSFRITARRAFKTFPMTSVELNRDLGAHVLALRPEVRVSLEHPELNVRVEVLPDEAFVYCDPQPGAGGLPVGTGGTVAALLSGGIDSPVAAWRLMRRGCRVVFVHFHSAPYLPDLSRGKARELVTRLTQWQYHSRLFIVPFGEIQREVVLSVPPPFRVVVYRRLMVRIAERLARHAGALALVTGESLGQVASQTLHNLTRIDEVAAMPILRPAHRHGQARDHRAGPRARHLRDLHRAGRRLLHPLHAAPSRHPDGSGRGRGAGSAPGPGAARDPGRGGRRAGALRVPRRGRPVPAARRGPPAPDGARLRVIPA